MSGCDRDECLGEWWSRYGVRSCLIGFLILLCTLPSSSRGEPGTSAEILFPSSGVRAVSVGPTGEWVAAVAIRDTRSGVLVWNVELNATEPIFVTEDRVARVDWVGRDEMLIEVHTFSGPVHLWARLAVSEGRISVESDSNSLVGYLVDPRPLVDGEVIWAFDPYEFTSIHRVRLDELMSLGDKRSQRGRFVLPGKQLASRRGEIVHWIVDEQGDPRAAWMVEDDRVRILARRRGQAGMRPVREFDPDVMAEGVSPAGLGESGDEILVLAYAGHDTIGLHVLDAVTGELGREVFRRPDVDLVGVTIDPAMQVVTAVQYDLHGRRRYEYLDAFARGIVGGLREEFGTEPVELLSVSADGSRFAFRTASETNPGAYFVRDWRTRSSALVAREASEIDEALLSPSRAFVAESKDGTRVEAYLTVPRRRPHGDAGAPLVVMPHGGPVDVRDDRAYDPFVQYLASWGFAVLQVNYRGSAGYGREFIEAAKGQWARGIEDDIDAAVGLARAENGIDGDRLCIVGGSYGGFSALASVIRHRGRYACAVSINGVTDIPLMADSSDMADSKRAMDYYEEFIGDLESERDRLEEASPLYRAGEIDVPVFLIYGSEDRRVDPDNAHRMALMLDLFGKEWQELEIEGMGHGATRSEWLIIARSVRRFLTRHLLPEVEFEPDPVARVDDSRDPLSRLRIRR